MRLTSPLSEWLRGVRVLDMTAVLAGPHMTRVFSQMGAEVLKLEAVHVGDTTRGLPYRYAEGQSGYFNQQNLNKQSIAVDLATEEGRSIAHGLARVSDVISENFRPGVTRKLGVDYETLRNINPSLVYCSISGWGQTGPIALLTGEVRSTTAISGLMAQDTEGHSTFWERNSFADMNASIHGVTAVAAGLRRARATGEGCYIDISILEGLAAVNGLELPEVLMGGNGAVSGHEVRREGDRARVASGAFQCRDDRWVYLRALTPPMWAALADLVGLAPTDKTLSQAGRRHAAERIYGAVRTFCHARPAGAVVAALTKAGVSATHVSTVREVLRRPEMEANGLIQEVIDPFEEGIRVPAGLYSHRAYGGQPQRRAPLLGEHTLTVLRDVLGYTDARIRSLVAQRVVELGPAGSSQAEGV